MENKKEPNRNNFFYFKTQKSTFLTNRIFKCQTPPSLGPVCSDEAAIGQLRFELADHRRRHRRRVKRAPVLKSRSPLTCETFRYLSWNSWNQSSVDKVLSRCWLSDCAKNQTKLWNIKENFHILSVDIWNFESAKWFSNFTVPSHRLTAFIRFVQLYLL